MQPRAISAARRRTHTQLSSPGSTGRRPSIPETAVIEPISRNVLDTPPSRGKTDRTFEPVLRTPSPSSCMTSPISSANLAAKARNKGQKNVREDSRAQRACRIRRDG
jgi:hypothetical protein